MYLMIIYEHGLKPTNNFLFVASSLACNNNNRWVMCSRNQNF